MQNLIEALIKEGLDTGAYTACSILVAQGEKVLNTAFGGHLYEGGDKVNINTVYDMASCSKIMLTTPLCLLAIEKGLLCLDDKLERFFDVEGEYKNISIKELLTHRSGIQEHVILELYDKNPKNVLRTIFSLPLKAKDGTVRYSCLGFIVLANIIEKVFNADLESLGKSLIFDRLGMGSTGFRRVSKKLPASNIAATEINPLTGRLIIGEVHDENARFLDGVSGNAGIFSNLVDCHKYLSALISDKSPLLSPAMLNKAIQNYSPRQDAHRGLGFHLSGTECNFAGDLMPDFAFGHTGFTGTSMLIEPKTKFILVILSNRVCPSRENVSFLRLRRRIHNAIYAKFISQND